MQLCPCRISPTLSFLSKPLAYDDCCKPYHDGFYYDNESNNSHSNYNSIKAETAERLMRTRYSAFVQVLPNYIVKTTLPAQQDLLDIKAIETWARETAWAGLEIVAPTPKLGKRHAQVEFKAYYHVLNDNTAETKAHHELSSFVKVKNQADNEERWYFLDPTVIMNVTQKQPCICVSGQKFKRCCGLYLG